MEERFLFGWITGERGYIVYRHAKLSVFIEADLADTPLAGVDKTPMSARVTLQGSAREVLDQFRRTLGG